MSMTVSELLAIKDVAFENQLLKQYIKNWPA